MIFINCLGGSSGAGRTFFAKVLIEFLWSIEQDVNIVDCDFSKSDLSRSYLSEMAPKIYSFGARNSEDFFKLDDLLLVDNDCPIILDLPSGQSKNICDWLEYSLEAVNQITIYYWHLTRPNYTSLVELESLVQRLHTKGVLEIIYVRNLAESGWDSIESEDWLDFLNHEKVMSIDFPALTEVDAGIISQANKSIFSLLDSNTGMQAISRSRIHRFLEESFQQIRKIYPISPY